MKKAFPFPKCAVRPVEADYKTSAIPLYAGNPLIEALPPLQSSKWWKDKFGFKPKYDPKELSLPADERLHCVLTLLQLFVVQARHMEVREKLDMLLRIAYVGVSVDENERNKCSQRSYERIQSGDMLELGMEGLQSGEFFSLIGSSGLGKTWGVKRFKRWIYVVIWHPLYDIVQIPILYVLCPHNGSTRDFGRAILQAFDEILGTTYFDEYYDAPEETLIAIAASLFEKFFVGLLFIDEIQSISHKKSGGRIGFMDFFLQLFNKIHLSIVVIGTMKAIEVLQTTFRQARRTSSLGAVIWERHRRDSKDWARMEVDVWGYYWVAKPTAWTPELGDAMYDETQGITSLYIRLYILVQHRAIRLGDCPITPELVHKVARDNFQLLKPMLDALRSGNPARIAKYDDFDIPKMEQFAEMSGFHAREELLDTESPEGMDATQTSIRRQVIESLTKLGVQLPIASMHVDAILKENPYADALEVNFEALVRIGGKPKSRSARKAKQSKSGTTSAVVDGKLDIPVGYDALKAKGWIKPIVPPTGGTPA